MAPKAKKLARPQAQALRCTFHPSGTTALQAVLHSRWPQEDQDAALRAFVLHLLSGACSRLLRPNHPQTIVEAKGRVNTNGHGAWVFNYHQAIPTTAWDECTVLCRGLVVLFPRSALLAEGLSEEQLAPGSKIDGDNNAVLRRLCSPDARYRCRAFEPMPKFWEAGEDQVAPEDISNACNGARLELMRLEEKVDGNLGLLYPQLDEDLHPIPDAAPLLATKGTPYSIDIEQKQMPMLHRLYPNLRLAPGMHAILEVVDVTKKVCVPYPEESEGARLIALCTGEAWLPQDAVDAVASEWQMPRPAVRQFPPGATLDDVRAMARDYRLEPGALLDEGYVVHLTSPSTIDLVRLKVHTHVWNTVHGWWEDNRRSDSRITVASVLPVLRDLRFSSAGPAAFEPSLMKLKKDAQGQWVPNNKLVLLFQEAVGRAAACLASCAAALADVWASTASVPRGKGLVRSLEDLRREHPALSPAQFDGLKVCVLGIRARPSFEAPLTGKQLEALPGALRATCCLGEGAAGGASPDASNDERELIGMFSADPICGMLSKLLRVWAQAEQTAWEADQKEEQVAET